MNFFELIKAIPVSDNFYPPLVPLVGAVFGNLFGNNQDGFTLSMLFFHILLILATFGNIRHIVVQIIIIIKFI